MAKKQKGLGSYMAVGAYSAVLIFRNLTFVLFLGFLGIIYIANAHYSEKKVREIQALQDDIKELRWRYMAARADLMYSLNCIIFSVSYHITNSVSFDLHCII